MNEFVVIFKSINFKNGKLKNWNFENVQNQMVINKIITLVVIFFQIHLSNSQKKLKQNQLDDCKVKILENQSEFDILTKDSVYKIEKWTLKKHNKIKEIIFK